MEVSLRHWPIFVTGLLLGAAGTMALGLHQPTQAELAAAAPAPASLSIVATPAASVTAASDTLAVEQERMLAAAEAFTAQERLAASEAPYAVAIKSAPRPKARKTVQEVQDEASPAPAAASTASPAIAIAPEMSEPDSLRSATSVMGAAPQRVQAARGSAHVAEVAESRSSD